jgi:hypothetical protein
MRVRHGGAIPERKHVSIAWHAAMVSIAWHAAMVSIAWHAAMVSRMQVRPLTWGIKLASAASKRHDVVASHFAARSLCMLHLKKPFLTKTNEC